MEPQSRSRTASVVEVGALASPAELRRKSTGEQPRPRLVRETREAIRDVIHGRDRVAWSSSGRARSTIPEAALDYARGCAGR